MKNIHVDATTTFPEKYKVQGTFTRNMYKEHVQGTRNKVQIIPCLWPPKSNVVNFIPPMDNSSDAKNKNKNKNKNKTDYFGNEHVCWSLITRLD